MDFKKALQATAGLAGVTTVAAITGSTLLGMYRQSVQNALAGKDTHKVKKWAGDAAYGLFISSTTLITFIFIYLAALPTQLDFSVSKLATVNVGPFNHVSSL